MSEEAGKDLAEVPDEADAITSRTAFHAAVAELLTDAADHGCRELLLCDPDFADWPLGDRAIVDTLTRWAAPHRRLTVLATRWDAIVRVHPRWVAWRRTYAHVVDCREPDEADIDAVPTLLLAQGRAGLRMADMRLVRGRRTQHAGDLLRWADEIDAVLQRSGPSFPSTTLGL